MNILSLPCLSDSSESIWPLDHRVLSTRIPGQSSASSSKGNLTVQVNGPARLSEPGSPSGDGTPVAGAEATTNTEFELAVGEQIVYLPQTPMTFRNGTEDPLSIMSVVILPAGNQHPPGITYLNGQPAANAFDGVSPEILGDGVATVLPRGGMDVVVERIRLAPGEANSGFRQRDFALTGARNSRFHRNQWEGAGYSHCHARPTTRYRTANRSQSLQRRRRLFPARNEGSESGKAPRTNWLLLALLRSGR